MVAVPPGYDDLLERPLYGHLATTRPDGSVQVSPIWFDWDGELLRFAHTTKRQKYRNVQRDPRVAMSISDPDNPYRYLEVRGDVERIEPDPAAAAQDRLVLIEAVVPQMDIPPLLTELAQSASAANAGTPLRIRSSD
jgi:PPOX class probable F420-dependent enzyme